MLKNVNLVFLHSGHRNSDSLEAEGIQAFEYFKQFLQLFNNLKTEKMQISFKSHTLWGYKFIACGQQSDTYNCGIFLLDFVKQYLEHKTIEVKNNFNCEIERRNLKNKILQFSDDMEHLCLKCGYLTETNSVGCDNCLRWLHYKCTKNPSLPYHKLGNRKFICDLCKK